jgi:hypothetical protein
MADTTTTNLGLIKPEINVEDPTTDWGEKYHDALDAIDATHNSATPSTQALGDAASAGVATTVARSDHKHAMPANPLPIANGGTNSSTALAGNRFIISEAGKINESPALTASRVVVTNANGLPAAAGITSTELSYLAGLSADIVPQLAAKLAKDGDTFTGTLYGGNTPVAGLSTTATTGGSLAAATYYYKVYPLFGSVVGNPSPESSVVVGGANNAVTVSWTAVTGATGYRIARGTAQGSQSGYYSVTTTPYTDTGAAYSSATNAYTAATATWLALGGALTLPASSGQITWLDYVTGLRSGFIGVTSSGEMEYRTGSSGSAPGHHVFEDGSDKVIAKLVRTGANSEIVAYNSSNALGDLDITYGSTLNLRPGNTTKVSLTASAFTSDVQFIGKGTATNDSASAGYIGEYVSANNTSFTNAGGTGVWTDITSVSLTAGDWDVWGGVQFVLNGATMTYSVAAVSKNSGTTTTDHVDTVNVMQNLTPTGPADVCISIPPHRLSLSSTTTVYVKFQAGYSAGTPRARGSVRARRRR